MTFFPPPASKWNQLGMMGLVSEVLHPLPPVSHLGFATCCVNIEEWFLPSPQFHRLKLCHLGFLLCKMGIMIFALWLCCKK